MAELASKPADKNVNNARPTSSDSSSKDYIKYIYIFLQQIIPSPNLIFFSSPDTPIPPAPSCILGIYFFFFIIFSSSSFNVFVSPTTRLCGRQQQLLFGSYWSEPLFTVLRPRGLPQCLLPCRSAVYIETPSIHPSIFD